MTKPLTDLERAELQAFRTGRPFHTHRCTEGEHAWYCNSPYCADVVRDCTEHGGEEPRA